MKIKIPEDATEQEAKTFLYHVNNYYDMVGWGDGLEIVWEVFPQGDQRRNPVSVVLSYDAKANPTKVIVVSFFARAYYAPCEPCFGGSEEWFYMDRDGQMYSSEDPELCLHPAVG